MQGDNIPLEEMRRVQREEKRRLLRTPHEEWKARQRALAAAREPPQRKVEALKIKKSRIMEVPTSNYSSSEEDTTGSDSLGPHSESPVPSASQTKEETTQSTAAEATTTTASSTTKVKHKKLRTSKTT